MAFAGGGAGAQEGCDGQSDEVPKLDMFAVAIAVAGKKRVGVTTGTRFVNTIVAQA